MSGFTAPDGERYPIFGEGGGQRLADELDVPLLGQVPLTMPLRAHADAGIPLVAVDPDDPAAQAIRHTARGLIALTPAQPVQLPVLDVVQAGPPQPVGMSLPMA
jgi:ATP-binding protein involved in chromosome partitioning